MESHPSFFNNPFRKNSLSDLMLPLPLQSLNYPDVELDLKKHSHLPI